MNNFPKTVTRQRRGCDLNPGPAARESSTLTTRLLSHPHTYYTPPFNGPFSGTTRVSRYQKSKTNLDFTEAKDSEWQWHQLGHMLVCTSLQPDNHASTPLLSFLQARCASCCPTNSVKALKAKAPTHWLVTVKILVCVCMCCTASLCSPQHASSEGSTNSARTTVCEDQARQLERGMCGLYISDTKLYVYSTVQYIVSVLHKKRVVYNYSQCFYIKRLTFSALTVLVGRQEGHPPVKT